MQWVLDRLRAEGAMVAVDDAGAGLQLRANVHASIGDLAHRLSTSTSGDTVAPVLVTDNEGHYLGAIAVQRLLATLASQPALVS